METTRNDFGLDHRTGLHICYLGNLHGADRLVPHTNLEKGILHKCGFALQREEIL